MILHPFVGPWPLFQFRNPIHNRQDSWTGNQPVARPQPTQRITQTQNKRTQYRHALSGSWTHDPSVRAGEGSSGLRQHGHCARLIRKSIHNYSCDIFKKIKETPIFSAPQFFKSYLGSLIFTNSMTFLWPARSKYRINFFPCQCKKEGHQDGGLLGSDTMYFCSWLITFWIILPLHIQGTTDSSAETRTGFLPTTRVMSNRAYTKRTPWLESASELYRRATAVCRRS
jgi:hypothetical protein